MCTATGIAGMVETGTNARLAAGAATIVRRAPSGPTGAANGRARWNVSVTGSPLRVRAIGVGATAAGPSRSEEHTSELQSLMRISYAVFCLKKKKQLVTDSN